MRIGICQPLEWLAEELRQRAEAAGHRVVWQADNKPDSLEAVAQHHHDVLVFPCGWGSDFLSECNSVNGTSTTVVIAVTEYVSDKKVGEFEGCWWYSLNDLQFFFAHL